MQYAVATSSLRCAGDVSCVACSRVLCRFALRHEHAMRERPARAVAEPAGVAARDAPSQGANCCPPRCCSLLHAHATTHRVQRELAPWR